MKKLNLIEYIQGTLSHKKAKKVEEWILKKPSNQKYFSELKNLWVFSGVSKKNLSDQEIDDGIKNIEGRIQIEKRQKFSYRYLLQYTARAAAILFFPLLILTALLYSKTSEDPYLNQTSELVVPIGDKSELILSDGTKVWLNSNSRLVFNDFNHQKIREVMLSGEAYFDVAHDKDKPFIVNTNEINIKVFGTEFNVKAYPGEKHIETTLVKGIISVSGKYGKIGGNETVILRPNQKLTITKTEKSLNTEISDFRTDIADNEKKELIKTKKFEANLDLKKQVQTDVITAWKDKKLLFRDESFENVATKMERWYDVDIHFENEKLKDFKYWGSFDDETIEQALEALRLTTPFNYTLKKRDVYITRKE